MKRETDNTFPNPPDDIPPGPHSPLMDQAKQAFGLGPFQLPWPRKPLSKGKGPAKAPSSKPMKTRSGVHKLGKKHVYKGNWF